LHKLQTNIVKAGFLLIYSDTDSVYFCDNGQIPLELSNQRLALLKNDLSEDGLGGAKLEISDKIEEDFSNDAVFVCLKMYSYRGSKKSEKTGEIPEFTACKGLAQWLLEGKNEDKIERENRRKQNGINKAYGFDDLADLVQKGKPIMVPAVEQMITEQKKFEDENASTIKSI
jgi:hypothetical protein